MTNTRQMVITLFIAAIVCAVILSFVYGFTTPRIDETRRNAVIASLKEVINATDFVEIIPDTLWQARDSSGAFVGIVFRVFPQGYGGLIPITVGLNRDQMITGIRIASAAEGLEETPGLGSKITESKFTEQFVNKSVNAVKLKKEGGEIDAVTAATISSRAVTNGVRNGIEKYLHYLREDIGERSAAFFPEAKLIEIIADHLWYAISENETLGMVFEGTAFGYLDSIKYVAGIDTESHILGVEIIYSNETEGIGESIRDKAFLEQFKLGWPDAISGATVSSKALIEAVKKDFTQYKGYLP